MKKEIVIDIYNNPLHAEIFRGAHRLIMSRYEEILKEAAACIEDGLINEKLAKRIRELLSYEESGDKK